MHTQPHKCSRSLPHSPHPHPHSYTRRCLPPCRSLSGSVTPSSLPSSYQDRKHLFPSHSSSNLPPFSETFSVRSFSPRTVQSTSLDQRSVHSYLPVPTSLLGACGTDEGGTVVSLDRNSLSSNCFCPSSVAADPSQRSTASKFPLPLASSQSGRTSAIISLDQFSVVESAEHEGTAVVSLDRAGRSSIRDQRLWSEHKSPSSPLVTVHESQGEPPFCVDAHRRSPSSHIGSSAGSSSSSNGKTNFSLRSREESPCDAIDGAVPQPHLTTLNLDSCIKETPSFSSRSGSGGPCSRTRLRSLERQVEHQMNGCSLLHAHSHALNPVFQSQSNQL